LGHPFKLDVHPRRDFDGQAGVSSPAAPYIKLLKAMITSHIKKKMCSIP